MSEWQSINTAPKDGTVIRGKNDHWESYGIQPEQNVRFARGDWELVPLPMTLRGARSVPNPTQWKPLHAVEIDKAMPESNDSGAVTFVTSPPFITR